MASLEPLVLVFSFVISKFVGDHGGLLNFNQRAPLDPCLSPLVIVSFLDFVLDGQFDNSYNGTTGAVDFLVVVVVVVAVLGSLDR